ncbi:MAG TPA: hypothetical protein VNG90_04930 [Candidatus Acidoferrum sp.]|nr:hypothetical protein [Candidatus Acidoferrum sp.]
MSKPQPPDNPLKLHVKILSPTQTLYDSLAVSVSAINEVGPFDILADHANFFSMLTTGDVIVNNNIQNFTFHVTKGIIKVTNNTVICFVDIEPGYGQEAA